MTRRTAAWFRLVARRALVQVEAVARLAVVVGLLLVVVEVGLGLPDPIVAGTAVIALAGLAMLAAVPASRALHRWWTGESALIRRIYRHVDEILGARRYEADRAATLRRRTALVSKELAGLLFAGAQPSGAIPLPRQGRMRRYVQVEFAGARPWWRRWQPWQVQAVTLWWTSEANALAEGFITLSGRKVAQALRLKRTDELEPAPKWDAGLIVFARRKPGAPPRADVPYAEVPDV
jgi:hypothetical protein